MARPRKVARKPDTVNRRSDQARELPIRKKRRSNPQAMSANTTDGTTSSTGKKSGGRWLEAKAGLSTLKATISASASGAAKKERLSAPKIRSPSDGLGACQRADCGCFIGTPADSAAISFAR